MPLCAVCSAIFLQRLSDAIQKSDRTVLGLEIVAGALLRIEGVKKTNGENRSEVAMFSYPVDETLSLFLRERVTQKNEVKIG